MRSKYLFTALVAHISAVVLGNEDLEFAISEAEQVPGDNKTAAALEQKLPVGSISTVFGNECYISNQAFPNEFLYMVSGWKGDYPVMQPGLPRRPLDTWNWKGMWLVIEVTVNGQVRFKIISFKLSQ
jgi:hypothetical protein